MALLVLADGKCTKPTSAKKRANLSDLSTFHVLRGKKFVNPSPASCLPPPLALVLVLDEVLSLEGSEVLKLSGHSAPRDLQNKKLLRKKKETQNYQYIMVYPNKTENKNNLQQNKFMAQLHKTITSQLNTSPAAARPPLDHHFAPAPSPGPAARPAAGRALAPWRQLPGRRPGPWRLAAPAGPAGPALGPGRFLFFGVSFGYLVRSFQVNHCCFLVCFGKYQNVRKHTKFSNRVFPRCTLFRMTFARKKTPKSLACKACARKSCAVVDGSGGTSRKIRSTSKERQDMNILTMERGPKINMGHLFNEKWLCVQAICGRASCALSTSAGFALWFTATFTSKANKTGISSGEFDDVSSPKTWKLSTFSQFVRSQNNNIWDAHLPRKKRVDPMFCICFYPPKKKWRNCCCLSHQSCAHDPDRHRGTLNCGSQGVAVGPNSFHSNRFSGGGVSVATQKKWSKTMVVVGQNLPKKRPCLIITIKRTDGNYFGNYFQLREDPFLGPRIQLWRSTCCLKKKWYVALNKQSWFVFWEKTWRQIRRQLYKKKPGDVFSHQTSFFGLSDLLLKKALRFHFNVLQDTSKIKRSSPNR